MCGIIYKHSIITLDYEGWICFHEILDKSKKEKELKETNKFYTGQVCRKLSVGKFDGKDSLIIYGLQGSI